MSKLQPKQASTGASPSEMRQTVKLSVTDLRVGMYVSSLDRDWLDTPFLMQGFMIESEDHLDLLAEYCESVWVDKVYEQKLDTSRDAIVQGEKVEQLYIHKKSTVEELGPASGVYQSSTQITKDLMEQVRLGNAIDSNAAKGVVSACVGSILNNPDALLWVSKIRNKDEYTAEHSLNVCVLSIAFARRLGFNEAELNQIGICGLLHDVGKMQIDPAILNKPDPLTRQEWQSIANHPAYGRNLLMSTPSIYTGAIDVAYSHHERLDGKGYPRGLSGSAISTYTRIVTIADAYDAMTANRCYANARSSTDALKILFHGKDKQFDSKLVDVFMRMIGLYPPGSIVELVNGSLAVVLSSNMRNQRYPEVIIVTDFEKVKVEDKMVFDLSAIEEGGLEEDYKIKRTHPDGSFGIKLQELADEGFEFKRAVDAS